MIPQYPLSLRLSLQVQAETLQYQCVRQMHENDLLGKKVMHFHSIFLHYSSQLDPNLPRSPEYPGKCMVQLALSKVTFVGMR